MCSIYVILLTHILVIFYTFEQTRNKLNTNNFLKYYSLVSNVPKYIKDHLKENCGVTVPNITTETYTKYNNI